MVKRNSPTDKLEGELKKVYEVVEKCGATELSTAVLKVSEKLKIKRYEAARRIYKLRELGLIEFIDPNPPTTLTRYLFSTYSVWFWLIALAVILVFSSIYLLPSSPPFIYLRYVFGSVFILYLPGSSLIELLYPKPGDLSQLERVALSIGLSLALVPLIGLVLNYTPWGIKLDPVFASLSLVTLGLAGGGVYRKFNIHRLRTYALED